MEEKNKEEKCLVCHKDNISYLCMPCRCPVLCLTCAKKMATGGICKKCKEFFIGCKRILSVTNY
jgi:hypothetical protein